MLLVLLIWLWGECGHHSNWMLVSVSSILSGADPEFNFDLHMVPSMSQPTGEGDCRYPA